MKHRGFTLIEVVIAVTILGFIGLLTFGTFTRAIDARNRAMAITTHYHQIRQAMIRMAHEISTAYISAHRDCSDPRTKTIFSSHNASAGMRLDFTSFSHVKMKKDANESDQNELSYFIDHDPEQTDMLVLMRREQNRIDENPDEGGKEQVLAENVSNLEFSFYDPKNDRWVDDWDTTHRDYKGRLPMFVKIELSVKTPQGKEEKFETKTRVFLRNEISIIGGGFARCPE